MSRVIGELEEFVLLAVCILDGDGYGISVKKEVERHTGRTEATTRLMLQLELVGLSRLGSNPLSVLKENIPGYTLLREDASDPPLRTYVSEGASAPPAR